MKCCDCYSKAREQSVSAQVHHLYVLHMVGFVCDFDSNCPWTKKFVRAIFFKIFKTKQLHFNWLILGWWLCRRVACGTQDHCQAMTDRQMKYKCCRSLVWWPVNVISLLIYFLCALAWVRCVVDAMRVLQYLSVGPKSTVSKFDG